MLLARSFGRNRVHLGQGAGSKALPAQSPPCTTSGLLVAPMMPTSWVVAPTLPAVAQRTGWGSHHVLPPEVLRPNTLRHDARPVSSQAMSNGSASGELLEGAGDGLVECDLVRPHAARRPWTRLTVQMSCSRRLSGARSHRHRVLPRVIELAGEWTVAPQLALSRETRLSSAAAGVTEAWSAAGAKSELYRGQCAFLHAVRAQVTLARVRRATDSGAVRSPRMSSGTPASPVWPPVGGYVLDSWPCRIDCRESLFELGTCSERLKTGHPHDGR